MGFRLFLSLGKAARHGTSLQGACDMSTLLPYGLLVER